MNNREFFFFFLKQYKHEIAQHFSYICDTHSVDMVPNHQVKKL